MTINSVILKRQRMSEQNYRHFIILLRLQGILRILVRRIFRTESLFTREKYGNRMVFSNPISRPFKKKTNV